MNIFIIALITIVFPQLGICAAHTAKEDMMDKYTIISKAERREITPDNFDKYFKALEKAKAEGDVDNLGYAYRVLGDNMSEIGAFELAAPSYAKAYDLGGEEDHDFMIFLEVRLQTKKPYDDVNILEALKRVNVAKVKMLGEKLDPSFVEGKAIEYKA